MVRDDTNAVLASGDHIAAIKHYVDVKAATDTIKTAREALAEIEDSLSKEQIPDVLRAKNIKSIKIEGIGTVGYSNRFSCSILDKESGYKWLRDNNHGSLITETVNASTLAAFAKDLLENSGLELPTEMFKVGTSTYTSIRK
jgi:hypothetical protein